MSTAAEVYDPDSAERVGDTSCIAPSKTFTCVLLPILLSRACFRSVVRRNSV